MENNKGYEVRLANIEIFGNSLQPKTKDFVGETFSYDIAADKRVNVDRKLIFILITIDVRDGDKPESLSNCKVLFSYELNNFSEIIQLSDEKENIYTVPDDLDFQLRNLSISTTRGVMYSMLKGTYLHGAMLPILGVLPHIPQESLPKD